MNLKSLKTEQIKDYIQAELKKGRSMPEIVKEVADTRNDFTILSVNDSPEVAHQKIVNALETAG